MAARRAGGSPAHHVWAHPVNLVETKSTRSSGGTISCLTTRSTLSTKVRILVLFGSPVNVPRSLRTPSTKVLLPLISCARDDDVRSVVVGDGARIDQAGCVLGYGAKSVKISSCRCSANGTAETGTWADPLGDGVCPRGVGP